MLLSRGSSVAGAGNIGMTLLPPFTTITKNLCTANAAQTNAYLLVPGEAPGTVQIVPVGNSGKALGEEGELEIEKVTSHYWAPEAQLVLFTDGIIEVMIEEKNAFDRKKFTHLLRDLGAKNRGLTLVNALWKEWETVAAQVPQQDDVTLIVCNLKKAA